MPFLQSAVEPWKVHKTSWTVYTALIIPWNMIPLWNTNFSGKAVFALYWVHNSWGGRRGAKQFWKKYLFCFFPNLCPKRNANSSGEVNFSEKRFFWTTLAELGKKIKILVFFFLKNGQKPTRVFMRNKDITCCGLSSMALFVVLT